MIASVSIHAPAWGATRTLTWASSPSQSFNPRARVGRDWRGRIRVFRGVCFNPRARVGRDSPPRLGSEGMLSFNPRARVGRDAAQWCLKRILCVSIHAPAWGATLLARGADRRRGVSIHAPAWGATHAPVDDIGLLQFQSTRPRGARPQSQGGGGGRGLFQSTRPRGARPKAYSGGTGYIWFQSTRPRGARLGWKRLAPEEITFQSTRPRGARPVRMPDSDGVGAVSIHAPAWGATSCRR